MSRKKLWRIVLATYPVTWGCYNPRTFEPNCSTRNGPWTRLVRLQARTLDDRELDVLLTPTEARELARRLNQQADAIDRMNAEHSNGYAPDTAIAKIHP